MTINYNQLQLYCNVRAEGFNINYGEGRTVYDYYFDGDNLYYEDRRGIKYPSTGYDSLDPEMYNIRSANGMTKEQLFSSIKRTCDSFVSDTYYSDIYIGCNDAELLSFLKTTQRQKQIGDVWYDDYFESYHDYPKKPIVSSVKTLKKHRSSNKEDVFIKICQKYVPDLECQVVFTIDGKKYIVDGYSKSTNTIFEFLGDYYHGNPDTYDANFYNDKLKKTACELHDEWIKRKSMFKALNYKLIYLWENEYDKMTKKDIHNWFISQL